MRRSADELNKMRKAGKVVAEMHEATRAAVKPGVTLLQLNEIAAEVIAKRGARSNFLNYNGFPAVICTSPNDMIVHGIPDDTKLKEGDIIETFELRQIARDLSCRLWPISIFISIQFAHGRGSPAGG
jgi:methionyl aminopeptidase